MDQIIHKKISSKLASKHNVRASKKVLGYIYYPLLIIIVLVVLGFPLSALGTIFGALGLGLAFALREMIANFVSGILLLITRPFSIGDQIEVTGERGTIQDINIRATEIKTYDGKLAIIPNSDLYSGKVINQTAFDKRRFEVIVGIGYDENIKEAKEIGMDVLENSEKVLEEPEPQILVNELGESSINLELRGWASSNKYSMVKATSDITQKVRERYGEKGIDIPFPIRTVYFHGET